MPSTNEQPSQPVRRSLRNQAKNDRPYYGYAYDSEDDDDNVPPSDVSSKSDDSLILGSTIPETQLNELLSPHVAALTAINIPDTVLGNDSLFLQDSQSDGTVTETPVSNSTRELFDADIDAMPVSDLSALAMPYVPNNYIEAKKSTPVDPTAWTPLFENVTASRLSTSMSEANSPSSSPPLVTDSMLPDPTSASQRHHAIVAQLYNANLQIASLQEQIRQLKDQALSDSVAHALQIEQLKTTIPSNPAPTCKKKSEEVILFRSYGPHHVLSNFLEEPLQYEGRSFRSAEHVYQWKCAIFHKELILANKISHARTASQAKRLSHSIRRSAAWHGCKTDIMRSILLQKVKHSPRFKAGLLSTAGKKLIHNVESDNFWGCGVDLQGSNVLGSLLEDLREQLTLDQSTATTPSLPTPPPVRPAYAPQPSPPSKKRVVVIGNSNARGISQELLDRGVDAVGFVYPGGTLQRLTTRVKETASSASHTDAVVIMAGDIEAKDCVPADNIVARYQHLIAEVKHSYPLTRVLLSGLPQAGDTERRQILNAVNHQLQIVAANDRLLTFVDNHNATLRDSIHLTRSAKSKLCMSFATCVKKFF